MQPTLEFSLVLAARGGNGPPPDWVIMLFLGSSLLLAATAVHLWIRVKKRLGNAEYADGKVIRFLEQSEGRGRTSQAPVIRFTACDGSSHVVNSSVFSHPPAFELGDTIQVVYPAGKPDEAEYVGLFAQWGGVMITGGIAAVLCLLGLAFKSFSHGHAGSAEPRAFPLVPALSVSTVELTPIHASFLRAESGDVSPRGGLSSVVRASSSSRWMI